MTIDERLEALAVRHEALAQSVEMLLASQREHRDEWEKYRKETEILHRDMMQALARLLNVSQVHNERLNEHEKRIGRLEDEQQ